MSTGCGFQELLEAPSAALMFCASIPACITKTARMMSRFIFCPFYFGEGGRCSSSEFALANYSAGATSGMDIARFWPEALTAETQGFPLPALSKL